MIIYVTSKSGERLTFNFGAHSHITKMVNAIKENYPSWIKIEIVISNNS